MSALPCDAFFRFITWHLPVYRTLTYFYTINIIHLRWGVSSVSSSLQLHLLLLQTNLSLKADELGFTCCEHIIQTLSQPVFALTHKCRMFSGEAAKLSSLWFNLGQDAHSWTPAFEERTTTRPVWLFIRKDRQSNVIKYNKNEKEKVTLNSKI